MITDVTFERTTYQAPPFRFEAGTGNIADAVGLGAALEYLEKLGIENIGRYEHDLLGYATHQLSSIGGVQLIVPLRTKPACCPLSSRDTVRTRLDRHSTAKALQSVLDTIALNRSRADLASKVPVRPSLAFYNTCAEVDRMAEVVARLASTRR
jgi:cysteine desulfurase/selenocysteine lyase